MELLSPAGDWDALRAGVQNGADAVYLGGSMGNARAGAVNFDEENLCRALDYCHERGVKLYLTANTLLFDDEFEALYQMILPAYRAGLDAAIVQDLGVAAFLKENFPDLKLHASTQMSISNLQGAKLIKDWGFSRVVPARECDLNEIKAMVRAGIEVECFGHGALCVSFSGQCLLSSFIGARSGNRGKCAQPCRLPYRLGDKEGYFLSTRDLCTIERVDTLCKSGITSLKLEGRMKRGEYVAYVTSAYRRAIDCAMEGKPFLAREEIKGLQTIFSRTFTKGYLFGKNDADVMYTLAPNHSGLPLGKVPAKGESRLQLKEEVGPGDTLLWRRGKEEGSLLVKTLPVKGWLSLPAQAKGAQLALVRSEQQERKARESYQKENRRKEISLTVALHAGQRPQLTVSDETKTVTVFLEEEIQPSLKQALEKETVLRQMAKLGEVPFYAGKIEIALDEGIFLPLSSLNALRRKGLEAFLRLFHVRRESVEKMPIKKNETVPKETKPEAQKPLLILQNEDLDTLCLAQKDCDLLYYAPRDLRELVKIDKVFLKPCYVVLPPLLFTEETQKIMNDLHHLPQFAGIVANNLGQIRAWKDTGDTRPVLAGEHCNLFNRRALAVLHALGVSHAVLSVEMGLNKVSRLAETEACEMIVHGALPLMTLRHCPLRTQRGEGEGHANCTLCKKNGYALIDRKGVTFPVRPYAAQSGCYLQLFNAHTLYGLGIWDRIRALPLAYVRVIGGVKEAKAYAAALRGEKMSLPVAQPTSGLWTRAV